MFNFKSFLITVSFFSLSFEASAFNQANLNFNTIPVNEIDYNKIDYIDFEKRVCKIDSKLFPFSATYSSERSHAKFNCDKKNHIRGVTNVTNNNITNNINGNRINLEKVSDIAKLNKNMHHDILFALIS